MAESIKSLFKPANTKKYTGNPRNIICRSSWERRFCNWCDINESIIEWGSEEFWIPYRAPDGKVRRYFPDFIMKVREHTGEIKTYVIEVKHDKQTRRPKPRKKVTKSMNAKPMKLIKQNGKQQENGVMIERSNLKSSPKKN